MRISHPKYRNLVLEGGGVRGVAFCGAIAALDRLGILKGIKNYAGSSAGAIAAGLLACGADIDFLNTEFASADFSAFLDYGNLLKIPSRLIKRQGLCRGEYFFEWYGKLIGKLTGSPDFTFRECRDKFRGRLVITSTCLNTRMVHYFDYKNNPDMPIRQAVRMSMSVPVIFRPVLWNDSVWVDGGVVDNFPMKAFHKDKSSSDIIDRGTIGLMLVGENNSAEIPVTDIWSFADALFDCYLSPPASARIDVQDWMRTIIIPCAGVSSFNFRAPRKTLDAIITAGDLAVMEWHADGTRKDVSNYDGRIDHR